MDGNIGENWRRFKRNYNIFMIAAGIDVKTDVVKIKSFLNAIGEDAVEMFDTFELNMLQRATYTEVIKSFEEFCKPRKNTVYERFVFYQRSQKDGENFDSFLIDIKRLVRSCGFEATESEMLRDRIVMGITDKKLQSRLLEIGDLTFEIAVQKCRASEITKEQASNMNKIVTVDENHVAKNAAYTQHRKNHQPNRNNNNYNGSKLNNGNQAQPKQQQRTTNNTNHKPNRNDTHTSNKNESFHCNRCNYTHKKRECPAFGKTCNSCSKMNHFSSMCKSKNISTIYINNRNCSEEYDFDNEYYVGSIERKSKSVNPSLTDDAMTYLWTEKIRINGSDVTFKIDTGTQIDVLPMNVFQRLGPKTELRKSSVTLRAFGGEIIEPKGTCTFYCEFANMSLNVNFAVVDSNFMPIFGLNTCTKLKVVERPLSRLRKSNDL